MIKFGLEDKYREFLLGVLNKFLIYENVKYYIFGSRAKEEYKEYSDIDIALDCNGKKLDDNLLLKIKSEFENSTFPYEVDIVDLNSISERFKSLIKGDLKELN